MVHVKIVFIQFPKWIAHKMDRILRNASTSIPERLVHIKHQFTHIPYSDKKDVLQVSLALGSTFVSVFCGVFAGLFYQDFPFGLKVFVISAIIHIIISAILLAYTRFRFEIKEVAEEI
jgi:hypothetical protein